VPAVNYSFVAGVDLGMRPYNTSAGAEFLVIENRK